MRCKVKYLKLFKESINKDLYDMYQDIPIVQTGIRATLTDFWVNYGSQIYYKIRNSCKEKGYGNIILKLALI